MFSLEADMHGNSAKIFKEGVRFYLHVATYLAIYLNVDASSYYD